jgi:hypothetical protein
LVVYQYLYVASNAADDIVYVEDFWLGVWWKMVGMLKSCMLWRTKVLSHIKPVHTLTPYNFKIHIITAFLSMARSPKWSFSSTFPSNSFDYFSDTHLYTFCGWIRKLVRTIVGCGISREICWCTGSIFCHCSEHCRCHGMSWWMQAFMG